MQTPSDSLPISLFAKAKDLSSINSYQVLLLLLVLLQAMTSNAKPSKLQCLASSCGDIHNISHPFRLTGDPNGCADFENELVCEDNRVVLYNLDDRFYVQSINYSDSSIRLVEDGLQKGNCSSLPRHSWTPVDFLRNLTGMYAIDSPKAVVIVNCSKPVNSLFYISTHPCLEGSYTPNVSLKWNLYALVNPQAQDVMEFCTIHSWTWSEKLLALALINSSSYNYEQIHEFMADGFDLFFGGGQVKLLKAFFCYFDFYRNFHFDKYFYSMRFIEYSFGKGPSQVCRSIYYEGGIGDDVAIWIAVDIIALLAKFIIGMPCAIIFLIYKYRRMHLAMDKNIEEFLQAHNNFMPIRYSYSDIKKITRNFKHKLGEGGYGSVYKGTLRSGNEVAIKILKHSKGHGQDFISEMSTIGRIYHVNVVQLIGFCFEGSKQALVYDFMSNGSLDKHIFAAEGDQAFDYRKTYEIALGIARGIEYLHRGCDIQILHFDIKPHNILLDKNFTPKISDFGLAKLYPIDRSIVSMTAARGTLGYMAPELFYKSIGGVSYKADVYSFGKLLMEMAGRRKNVNANAEHSSEIYFPLWVYDKVNEGESIGTEEVVEEEREVIKKMIIVALWCIQLIPDHRPPMNKVLEMLEGDINKIQMPPKPLLCPQDESVNYDKVETELETFSILSSTPILFTSSPFGDSDDV